MIRTRQTGFSLLEVMITLFVVAVGLLSVAGLQTLSKKSNFDAVQRTIAATLAQDLIERIRANPGQGANYLTDAIAGISEGNAPPAPGVDCTISSGTSAACTPAQVVAFDRYQWSRALFGQVETVQTGTGTSATTSYVGGLSSPTACVTNPNPTSPCGVYTVTIAWRGITPQPAASSAEISAGLAVSNPCGTGNNNAAYAPAVGQNSADSGKTLRRLLVIQTVIDDHSGSC